MRASTAQARRRGCCAQVSALPLLDPLVPGRMESMPNRLAFVPQFGTSLPADMVRPPGQAAGPADLAGAARGRTPAPGVANRSTAAAANAPVACRVLLYALLWPHAAVHDKRIPPECSAASYRALLSPCAHRAYVGAAAAPDRTQGQRAVTRRHCWAAHAARPWAWLLLWADPNRAGRRGAQGLLGRVRNAAVYLGSLVVEQARVLPMYARLCAGFSVDCFDRELLHSTAMFLYALTLPYPSTCTACACAAHVCAPVRRLQCQMLQLRAAPRHGHAPVRANPTLTLPLGRPARAPACA